VSFIQIESQDSRHREFSALEAKRTTKCLTAQAVQGKRKVDNVNSSTDSKLQPSFLRAFSGSQGIRHKRQLFFVCKAAGFTQLPQ